MQDRRISFVTTVAMVLAFASHSASASVAGLLEDFSGLGEHAGLHDPDWNVTGNTVEFINGTLALDHHQGEGYQMQRIIDGSGSFRTILEFSELDLGFRSAEMGWPGLYMSHQLSQPANGGVGAWLFDLEGDWIFLHTGGVLRPGATLEPMRNVPIRITITMDFPTKEFFVTYAADPMNIAADPIMLGPYEYRFGISDFQIFELLTVAQDSYMHGKLDYLSILPLDAAPGDFSGDGELDLDDLEMMTRATRIERVDSLFDLDGDTQVDANDIAFWVRELGNSYIGDANLDGEFNSSDLVLVFNAGEYEDDVSGASIWYSGDWNGDGDFTTADLVFAFQDAGYELGPRPTSHAIPEPTSIVLALTAAYGLISTRRRGLSN